jgi:hypothetical protein
LDKIILKILNLNELEEQHKIIYKDQVFKDVGMVLSNSIDPPDSESIEIAISILLKNGAITEFEGSRFKMTKVG